MKTTLGSFLIATLITSASVALAAPEASSAVPRATATVELIEPEKFTDFKSSHLGGSAETRHLTRELQRETNRLAAKHLPAGYRVMLRITDIDMAGEYEPERGSPSDQVRIMRGVYTPKIEFAYSVTDAEGNVVASGERRLTDVGYEMRLRSPRRDELMIETELLADFFREIARQTA